MSEYVFEARVDVRSRKIGLIPKGTQIRVVAADDDEAIRAMLAQGFGQGELAAFYGEPAG